MEYSSQITPQRTSSFAPPSNNSCKKSSAPSERTRHREFIEWLRAFPPGSKRICVCPSQGSKRKEKPRIQGILTSKNRFCLKEVFAVIPILSAGGLGAIVSVFIILLWGGGKRHQGFLQVFPIKVGGFPLILLLKPQSGGYSLAPPAFWRPIPRDR